MASNKSAKLDTRHDKRSHESPKLSRMVSEQLTVVVRGQARVASGVSELVSCPASSYVMLFDNSADRVVTTVARPHSSYSALIVQRALSALS